MVDFSINFEKGSDIEHYFKEFMQNADSVAFFDAKLFIRDNLAVFHIKPLMFPFYIFGFVIWIGGFLFTWEFNKGVFVAGLIPFITYPLYNRWWYILMLYIGKWKKKYKGKIKVV